MGFLVLVLSDNISVLKVLVIKMVDENNLDMKWTFEV